MRNGLTIDANGDKNWYKNNKLHREDGPAVEGFDGYIAWYKNGLLHRLDGPAAKFSNGNKYWWQNGEKHRLDGPAIILNNYKAWYYKGELIDCNSQEEFEKLIKLKAFW